MKFLYFLNIFHNVMKQVFEMGKRSVTVVECGISWRALSLFLLCLTWSRITAEVLSLGYNAGLTSFTVLFSRLESNTSGAVKYYYL